MPAIDLMAQRGDTVDFSAKRLRAVTPHDTNELEFVAKALYVGTGGDLTVIAQEDTEAETLPNVAAGSIVPVRAKIVLATGTTASGIVALI
jgi:hypothetical protein